MSSPGLPLQTYSFADVFATLIGPGAPAIVIGSSSGNSDEGITIEMEEDKDVMTGGADGSAMHTLRAGKRAKVTIRQLLTSPTNGFLSAAYNFQQTLSTLWGQNVLSIFEIGGGSLHVGSQVAFAKFAGTTYSKDGTMREWVFNVGFMDQQLGQGG